jgi:hypothetical protein
MMVVGEIIAVATRSDQIVGREGSQGGYCVCCGQNIQEIEDLMGDGMGMSV